MAGLPWSVSYTVSVGCCRHLGPAGREQVYVFYSREKCLTGMAGQIAQRQHHSKLKGH